MFIFEREGQSASRGWTERERRRIQSRLQGLSCQHRAGHGAQTHELCNSDLSRSRTLNRRSYPGALEGSWNELVKGTLPLMFGFSLKKIYSWGTWVAQSVEYLTSAQVMISQFMSSSPASGSLLSAQSLLWNLCLPLPVPLPLLLSLLKLNIFLKKGKKMYSCMTSSLTMLKLRERNKV